MKVLADYHHNDLFESLAMVFCDRFGWELYRPYGMEWYDSGLWQFERVWHGDQVARQYLQAWDGDTDEGEYWSRVDENHPGRVYRMVTIEQAHNLKPDLVISTLCENEPGWYGFARSVGAHYGVQIGNQGANTMWELAEFAMISATAPFKPSIPHAFYHQEFSLDTFRFEYPPAERDMVATWVQCLNTDPNEYVRFKRLAAAVPELRWRYHGHTDEHDEYFGGNLANCIKVAASMRAARIGLHLKTWSDGYGHVIHNLFAVGKPVVGTASYYADKLAGPLFVDGVTSFDVETRSDAETIDIIRRLATDDDYHRQISENSARRFREIVNFDEDAEKLRAMFETVLS